jgi:hypothetical protein
MKQIPINDEKIPAYNKKAVKLILILIVCGILLGIVLSYIFIDETNNQIEKMTEQHRFPRFDIRTEPLKLSEIIVPSLGVIIVSIATFLLIGLIIVYIKIFLTSNSKYIVGLLFFLIPFLIQTVASINVLRQLYISQAFADIQVKGLLGFGASGLGGIMVIVSIFEIIGLSILLYLSSE